MNPLLEILGLAGNALGAAGTVLDTPGSIARGLMAGKPGRALSGIFSPDERVGGREMLEDWGALDPNEEGFDMGDVAGFGAEAILDPLSIIAPALGARKAFRGMRQAGDVAPVLADVGAMDAPLPGEMSKYDMMSDEELMAGIGDFGEPMRPASEMDLLDNEEFLGQMDPMQQALATSMEDRFLPLETPGSLMGTRAAESPPVRIKDIFQDLWSDDAGHVGLPIPKEKPLAPTFYSRLEEAAKSLPDKPIKTQSVMGLLQKYPEGLSNEEIDVRRLKEFLASQGPTTAKSDLLEHLSNNPIAPGEVNLGAKVLPQGEGFDFDGQDTWVSGGDPNTRLEIVRVREPGIKEYTVKDNFENYWGRGATEAEALADAEINRVRHSAYGPEEFKAMLKVEPVMSHKYEAFYGGGLLESNDNLAALQSALLHEKYSPEQIQNIWSRTEDGWALGDPEDPRVLIKENPPGLSRYEVVDSEGRPWGEYDTRDEAVAQIDEIVTYAGSGHPEDAADIPGGQPSGFRIEEVPSPRFVATDRYGTPIQFGEDLEQIKATYKPKTTTDTKWSQYVNRDIPGDPDSYSERLLVMPTNAKEMETLRKLRDAGKISDAEYVARTEKVANRGKDFRSSHFGTPNIIAHTRSKSYTHPSGDQYMHMEEAQSDLNQAGEKNTYAGSQHEAKLKERMNSLAATNQANAQRLVNELEYRSPEYNELWEQNKLLLEEINKIETKLNNAVIDLPYKEIWDELAMKRLIREAAEKGHKGIQWNSGERMAGKVGDTIVGGELAGQAQFYGTNFPHDELSKALLGDITDRGVSKASPAGKSFVRANDLANELSKLDDAADVDSTPSNVDQFLGDLEGDRLPTQGGLGGTLSAWRGGPIGQHNISEFSTHLGNNNPQLFEDIFQAYSDMQVRHGYEPTLDGSAWQNTLLDILNGGEVGGIPPEVTGPLSDRLARHALAGNATPAQAPFTTENANNLSDWLMDNQDDPVLGRLRDAFSQHAAHAQATNQARLMPDQLMVRVMNQQPIPGLTDTDVAPLRAMIGNLSDITKSQGLPAAPVSDARSDIISELMGLQKPGDEQLVRRAIPELQGDIGPLHPATVAGNKYPASVKRGAKAPNWLAKYIGAPAEPLHSNVSTGEEALAYFKQSNPELWQRLLEYGAQAQPKFPQWGAENLITGIIRGAKPAYAKEVIDEIKAALATIPPEAGMKQGFRINFPKEFIEKVLYKGQPFMNLAPGAAIGGSALLEALMGEQQSG